MQQAAEERLKNGLATLPDVLEARSATAQAEYELQSALGTEQIAAGNLATAVGTSATASIHVQPLKELSIPEFVDERVESAIDRALSQRPDLNTALRQREAATALLEAAGRSYDAALESYNYGLRNLLDVTAAQRTLAQARSTDVLARTQVLGALANLAFRLGDLIQLNAARPRT